MPPVYCEPRRTTTGADHLQGRRCGDVSRRDDAHATTNDTSEATGSPRAVGIVRAVGERLDRPATRICFTRLVGGSVRRLAAAAAQRLQLRLAAVRARLA